MDPRLLDLYERELNHLRDMGQEFADEHSSVAGRLGMEQLECADPYVERLLEGFAFLAARVQAKIEAQFPRFTGHLLEMVYPDYLTPTPSMAIAQFVPDMREGSLAEGYRVARGSMLRTSLPRGTRTACQYQTAHDVTLWPIEIREVEYVTHALDTPGIAGVKAAIRIRLEAQSGLTFDTLALDNLELYFPGPGGVPGRLLEQFLAHSVGVQIQSTEPGTTRRTTLGPSVVHRSGYSDEQNLLPRNAAGFSGYRLLQEYFVFPQRFRFVEIRGLRPALAACRGKQVDVFVLVNAVDSKLENALSAAEVALHCAPVINLFREDVPRIHVNESSTEFEVESSRNAKNDVEIYRIESVTGFGGSIADRRDFLPFYGCRDSTRYRKQQAFFTVSRVPRGRARARDRRDHRTDYLGHDVFLSLVDGDAAPYAHDLKYLDVTATCSNRDLPLLLSLGGQLEDFKHRAGAPVLGIRCIDGPTKPISTHADGELAWRLVNHLSLNHLSLIDTEDLNGQSTEGPKRGAEALRSLLGLYARTVGDLADHVTQQVEGIRSVKARPIVRRIPGGGPVSFGRGLEIRIRFDAGEYSGGEVYLLGSVLEVFFAKYVSMNSFTETVALTSEGKEVMRWKPRIGQRQQL